MEYERPTYQDKLRKKLDESPYRPETIAWIGHICRTGRASEETILNLLDVLEEDQRATAKELANQQIEGQEQLAYHLPDAEGEALPPTRGE